MFHLLGQKIDTYLSSIYDKGVIEEMVTSSMNDASSIGYLAEKKIGLDFYLIVYTTKIPKRLWI